MFLSEGVCSIVNPTARVHGGGSLAPELSHRGRDRSAKRYSKRTATNKEG